jgi:hypothetical protein
MINWKKVLILASIAAVSAGTAEALRQVVVYKDEGALDDLTNS